MPVTNRANGVSVNALSADPEQAIRTFQAIVIDPIQVQTGSRVSGYAEYLARPALERENDEADVVDQQFARNTLVWLGFEPGDWTYNRPQNQQKANRPDYLVQGSLGVAFVWEDKNSTLDLELAHLQQMRRYNLGTAGYAVWCNMRRILAIRFLPGESLRYETLADISVAALFGPQPALDVFRETQATNLALFQLLFSKARFTRLADLSANISVDGTTFEERAIALDSGPALRQFINDSRQSLNHLRLAALARIREALSHRDRVGQDEQRLGVEWVEAQADLLRVLNHNPTLVADALEKLKPGECTVHHIRAVEPILLQSQGTARLSITLRSYFEKWQERAERINSVIQTVRFQTMHLTKIADAYSVWSGRQTDEEDVRPETFAEQAAYVFFVRLLLVRVLEDKELLTPRIASNGGYKDWSDYLHLHFQEIEGTSILSEDFSSLLTRKASHYYLHFFEQPIFGWFTPDDFLFVETLEFLCRYTFRNVSNDIIGFTYEEYIERNARNRKGHFLTRPDVVEYMLDLLDYQGAKIVGRNILDPACGSGSFLVHAARRYRQALLLSQCATHNRTEEEVLADPTLRVELARRFVDDLTRHFVGMEINPFACYLAEMNLLIQAIDDLFVLQQARQSDSIDRFQIINTNSLLLPREVLDEPYMETAGVSIPVSNRLSDRLSDEAYRVKAKVDEYEQGFRFVIFNPPYVNSRWEELRVDRFRHTEFFKTALSGDTNLYLLFIKLGLYYLGEQGRMVCIIPLTIFGDKSASAVRRLLRIPPFHPAAAVRFYRGDILFPGVDQAVGIIGVSHSSSETRMRIAGGNTTSEARAVEFQTDSEKVIEAVPEDGIWNGAWLVANDQISLDIWQQAKQGSKELSTSLAGLLNEVFDIKQGDLNATYINPLRIGKARGNYANGDVAIYKGEDVLAYAALPDLPSDWARPLAAGDTGNNPPSAVTASQTLKALQSLQGKESGLLLRQVARLNTRERLTTTWYERQAHSATVFTNELWRCKLKPGQPEQTGKALLALLNSRTLAYLLNLFSSNNHVNREELERIPIPDPQTFPAKELAELAQRVLRERDKLETDFVARLGVKLPETETGTIYLPPSGVLKVTRTFTSQLVHIVLRQEVRNLGPANGRIRALRRRNQIVSTVDATEPYAAAFATLLQLFLEEPGWQEETWAQVQNRQLPDPDTAIKWLQTYESLRQEAQESWNRFVSLQRQIEEIVADWYGFDAAMREAIRRGLPWARKRSAT